LERTRNLLFYIENETPLLKEKLRLLHFAPEWCLLPILKKADNLDYITADINPDYADYQVDIMDIPFPDQSFDYIICAHVLGHVPDEKKAVEELFRVLKNDGVALISTIIDLKNPVTFETEDADTPEKRLRYYSEPDLLRLHGRDFDQRLARCGFKVETINYPAFMSAETRKRFALGDGSRELIFRCTKS
jgi:SAM-dependent methyltransferase